MFRFSFRFALLATALGGLGTPVLAQDAAPAQRMMQVDARKLVDQFVEAGVLTREQADKMIANALVPADEATPMVAQAPAGSAVPVAGGTQGNVHVVPYIPAPVRAQIKAEVEAELANRAQSEGWARPGELPEWTKRITVSGDIRVRGEGNFFGDDNGDGFVDYQQINAQGGFDFGPNNPFNPPFLNTTEDRNRLQLRARLGISAQIDSWISAELRLATGNDNSPISTNQTLGGGGAELGRYSIWLDRAAVRLTPLSGLVLEAGRAANPFWTTSLMFDPDLSFDGGSIRYKTKAAGDFSAFATVGAFPLYNTAFNFGSNDIGAFDGRDKWLAAAQSGLQWQASDRLRFSGAAGYFHFAYLQGFPGACAFLQDVCVNDASALQFKQFGNTVIRLRRNAPDPTDPTGSPDPQLFGLASRFRVLELRGQADYRASDNLMVRLDGEYVRNLAFDRSDIGKLAPENNLEGNNYFGGDDGWFVNLTAGRFDPLRIGDTPALVNRGDWFTSLGYKFLQSDAVPDAFTDSDFHLGGTNAQGFILGGGYAFGHNTSVNLRWLSAQEASGDIYKNDVVQLDLITRF